MIISRLQSIICHNLGISLRSTNNYAFIPLQHTLSTFFTTRQTRNRSTETEPLTNESYQQALDNINDKFVEARDEIEFAEEDAETTYFNESCIQAKELVDDVLQEYSQLLGRLSEEERGKLQRSMGMKMEQLKAELERLHTLHD